MMKNFVKLSAWERNVLAECLEREVERGTVHVKSGEILLEKLDIASEVCLRYDPTKIENPKELLDSLTNV